MNVTRDKGPQKVSLGMQLFQKWNTVVSVDLRISLGSNLYVHFVYLNI